MIPRIRFDDLITIDEWAGALQQILTAATAATRSNNSSDRLDLQGLLLTYIKKSPPKVELLDVIARETIDDLALAEISLSLDRIASRNAELHRAASLIGAVASEAKKDARALQLESGPGCCRRIESAREFLVGSRPETSRQAALGGTNDRRTQFDGSTRQRRLVHLLTRVAQQRLSSLDRQVL
jgi:hypothetical protein